MKLAADRTEEDFKSGKPGPAFYSLESVLYSAYNLTGGIT